jgi:hypothetical protein
MTSKQRFYKLGEPGFVGTQNKRTDAEIKKDIEQTIQLIKNRKSGKVIRLNKTTRSRLTKSK